jgi:hypothetical protein
MASWTVIEESGLRHGIRSQRLESNVSLNVSSSFCQEEMHLVELNTLSMNATTDRCLAV